MKTVLAFGTFDLLHPGHLSYLEQAKRLGGRLVVIVATDNNVARIKGKKPTQSEKDRLAVIRALKAVDDAFVGFEDDMIKSVEKVMPDIVAIGFDQKPGNWEMKSIFAGRGIRAKIVRLRPLEGELHKSTRIKEKIRGA